VPWPTPDMALKAAELAAKLGGVKYVVSLVKSFWTPLRHGRVNLMLVGPGGTGKSTLNDFILTGRTDELPEKHEATSVVVTSNASNVERLAKLHDYPGQPRLFNDEFLSRASDVNNASRLIVIVCCSYGYHSDWGEPNSDLAKTPLALSPTTNDLNTALTECRKREVQFITDFVTQYMNQRNSRIHMITAVLKQDLWYNNSSNAEQFYATTRVARGNR
jgi:hypothetical protein